ncbi:MAG TPA: DUF1552 domain-containing protein [Bryobacteraceae bacterium]|jgi:hypothetical protein
MTFLTKKSISRRRLLCGVGAGLALPLLDSMIPASTALAATAAVPPRRFGAVFVPHGERPGYWNPKKVGADFELSPILEPLADFRDDLTVVSELCDPVDGHAVTVAAWLSGSIPKRTVAEDVYAGITIDQVIAAKIGRETVFPSLEVATEDFTGYIGGCDPAYACAYINTLSWKSPTQPLPMEINPRVLFERMFGRPGTAEQRLARMKTGSSILDSIQDDVKELQLDLGAHDRTRLSDYLDHVRETEARIQRAEKRSATSVRIPDAPIGIPDSFPEHIALQFELIALAYMTDLTRVFTFMLSRDVTQRTYPEIGITEPHHALSHHSGDEEKKKLLVKLNQYHVSMFEKFLKLLRETPEGDGTLLDNSMIMFGSGMSESQVHSRLDIPTLLVGGFQKRGSRHIQAAKETPIANFLLSLARYYGIEMERLGISTGTVSLT